MNKSPVLIIANKNYSSWSMRAWLALRLAGILFTERRIVFDRPGTEAELQQHSPSGKVPVLIEGTVRIWESLAIAEYAAELAPDRGLWPADAQVRAVARSVSAEMHAGFSALRENCPMNIRARYVRRELPPDAAGDVNRINMIWRECREQYGKEGDFLFGRFTIADAMFAPVASRFETYDISLDTVGDQYRASVLSHPLVLEWLQAAEAESERIVAYELPWERR